MSKPTTKHDPTSEVFDAVLTGIGRAVLGIFELIWWAILFPMVTIPIGATAAAWLLLGWPAGIAVAGVMVAALLAWRHWHRETFEDWFTRRARARFLAAFRYRRRWAALMTACGLSIVDGDRVLVPRLSEVLIGENSDIVRARMLPGHCPESWTGRAEHLAHAFGAQNARVKIAGPAQIEILFRRSDALADTVVVPIESVAGFKTLPGQKAA
ncbi:hypothetical protein ACFWM1_06355 [Nocardia sp. NPDC058379]|uniref:hypothetical protein n=1 Tax=unclassified Nocardia TaxID=2637762 RepID=UPI00364D8E2A